MVSRWPQRRHHRPTHPSCAYGAPVWAQQDESAGIKNSFGSLGKYGALVALAITAGFYLLGFVCLITYSM